MSLFDTIQCDYPLPDPEFQQEEFQTKDLDCLLNRYRISADGRLWRLPRGIAFLGDDPSPDPAKREDTNYHGEFSFYANTPKKWVEYRVCFTRGTLEWICRKDEVAPGFVDSLKRLARDAEELE